MFVLFQLLREIALMRESIQERDATILTIQKENQQLNLQAKQVGPLDENSFNFHSVIFLILIC